MQEKIAVSVLPCKSFPLPEEGATGHLTVDLVFAVLESKSQRMWLSRMQNKYSKA